MRKFILIPALAALNLLGLQSCNKTGSITTQTENATLQANESYTFTLPASTSDNAFQIKAQPVHASLSTISSDAAGNTVYQYIPVANYTGPDQVILTTGIEPPVMLCDSMGKHRPDSLDHKGPPPHKGKPGKHGDCDKNVQTVIINLDVVAKKPAVTVNKELN